MLRRSMYSRMKYCPSIDFLKLVHAMDLYLAKKVLVQPHDRLPILFPPKKYDHVTACLLIII